MFNKSIIDIQKIRRLQRAPISMLQTKIGHQITNILIGKLTTMLSEKPTCKKCYKTWNEFIRITQSKMCIL